MGTDHVTPGRGSFGCRLRNGEVDRGRRAGRRAVDRERSQRPRLEVAHEEAHREVGGHGGADRPDSRRACGRRCPGSRRAPGASARAAAPMIGVASRKAKRAASLCERPTRSPPPIDAPEREKPGTSASACAAPIDDRLRTSRPAARSARRRPRPSAALGGGAARRRRGAGRCTRGRSPRTGERRRACGACPAASARGSRPGSSRRRAASRASRPCRPRAISRSRSDRPRPLQDPAPSRARRSRSSTIAVARCVATRKREEVRGVLVDVPADELREDDAVAEARDGEELGHALEQAEHRPLEVADRHLVGGRASSSGRC